MAFQIRFPMCLVGAEAAEEARLFPTVPLFVHPATTVAFEEPPAFVTVKSYKTSGQ